MSTGVPVAGRQSRVVQAGERTNAEGKPVSNKLLLLISDSEYHSIRHHLEFIKLPHHMILHEENRKLDYVHFLNRGLISLVIATEDGRTAEAGLVGNEGMAGIPSAVGLSRSPLREVVQIAGDGFRIRASTLQKIMRSDPHLQYTLARYAIVQGLQIAQTAGCNRLHGTRQRLARWLLMVQDRVDSGLVSLTHDFLATMLGTDRPSLSMAAGALQKKGTIQYTRGAVKILNRKKLEAFSCECYGIIQQFNGELGIR
jgi:CRP-like cAMP-binding protein